jgi:hypothetical protein
MREAHPIDEFFRQALHGAAAAPPKELGARILAVSRRRRRALLWRRRSLLALLALLVLGASTHWLFMRQGGTAEKAAFVSAEMVSGSTSIGPSPTESPSPASLPAAVLTSVGAEYQAPPLAPQTAQVAVHSRTSGFGIPRDQSSRGQVADGHVSSTDAQAGEPAFGRTLTLVADLRSERADSLPFVAMRQLELSSRTRFAENGRAPDYHRPRGEWWLGPALSIQWRQQGWRGGPSALAQALDGNGKPRIGASAGILAGRRWTSGFSIWSGFELERTEQAYRHVEQLALSRQEVLINQIVTLNAQVVFVDADTLNTVVMQETVAEGSDLRVHARLPIELAWQHRRGRILLGARAGAALEYTVARSTSSLAQDASDGRIRAVRLTNEELRERHPMSLASMVGADVGYCFTERLSISATPYFATSFTTFGPRADVHSAPNRFGLRLQLLHRL